MNNYMYEWPRDTRSQCVLGIMTFQLESHTIPPDIKEHLPLISPLCCTLPHIRYDVTVSSSGIDNAENVHVTLSPMLQQLLLVNKSCK